VPEANKTEILNKSKTNSSKSQILNILESKIPMSKTLNKPEPKNSKVHIHKRPKLRTSKSQVLIRSESRFLKDQVLKSLVSKTKMISRPKDFKPGALNEYKSFNFRHKTQKKPKPFRTNPKGPIKIWAPKPEIVYVAYMLKRNGTISYVTKLVEEETVRIGMISYESLKETPLDTVFIPDLNSVDISSKLSISFHKLVPTVIF
jgi:hypothetical protein